MRPTIFWLAAFILGAPALALTTARLTDSDNGSLIRLQSFTPFAIPAYALCWCSSSPARSAARGAAT